MNYILLQFIFYIVDNFLSLQTAKNAATIATLNASRMQIPSLSQTKIF